MTIDVSKVNLEKNIYHLEENIRASTFFQLFSPASLSYRENSWGTIILLRDITELIGLNASAMLSR